MNQYLHLYLSHLARSRNTIATGPIHTEITIKTGPRRNLFKNPHNPMKKVEIKSRHMNGLLSAGTNMLTRSQANRPTVRDFANIWGTYWKIGTCWNQKYSTPDRWYMELDNPRQIQSIQGVPQVPHQPQNFSLD